MGLALLCSSVRNGTGVSIGPISSTRKTMMFGFSMPSAVDTALRITDRHISDNHKRITDNRNMGDGIVKSFRDPECCSNVTNLE